MEFVPLFESNVPSICERLAMKKKLLENNNNNNNNSYSS